MTPELLVSNPATIKTCFNTHVGDRMNALYAEPQRLAVAGKSACLPTPKLFFFCVEIQPACTSVDSNTI